MAQLTAIVVSHKIESKRNKRISQLQNLTMAQLTAIVVSHKIESKRNERSVCGMKVESKRNEKGLCVE
jgi:hypothetical protein